MQLEELRMNKKVGEDDPNLTKEIAGHKIALEAKHDALLQELQKHWTDWDSLIERNHGSKAPAEERAKITAKMVDVLNRRNYIRNLVRDVNAALEE
jgi:molecular chaperone HscB